MNKYLITPIKQRISTIWVTQDQLEKWIGKWEFFFILGVGRSGTAFMANLLNQVQGAYVFHEPVLEDFYAYIRAHYNPQDTESYMLGFRKKEIYMRMRHMTPGVYGEVNSVLRYHTEAIKKAFPNVTLIHIVRDGRDVVRSAMSRGTMTIKSPYSMGIHPSEQDPWKTRWKKMDRFAKICWLWQVENAQLRSSIGTTVQFEKVLSSYEYFQDNILNPCHIDVDKKTWETAVASPRNITSHFQMPKWDDWTPEQQKVFREICGDEMAKCVYAF
ncbi:MAG: sulfotransferase [Anaerolineales bacterium]